jgi:hypothetical protein
MGGNATFATGLDGNISPLCSAPVNSGVEFLISVRSMQNGLHCALVSGPQRSMLGWTTRVSVLSAPVQELLNTRCALPVLVLELGQRTQRHCDRIVLGDIQLITPLRRGVLKPVPYRVEPVSPLFLVFELELSLNLGDGSDHAACCAGVSMIWTPSRNLAPWMTLGKRFSPFNFRHVLAAAATSLNTISLAVFGESAPLVRTVR